jgi:hypothetical protein
MSTQVQIIAGGGWFTRRVVRRPTARFLTFLSIVWLPVASFGSFLFWSELTGSCSWRWLYGLAVLPEPAFIAVALLFWLTD